MKAVAKDFENYEKCGETLITLINTPKKGKKRVFFCLFTKERNLYHEINIKGFWRIWRVS